MYTQTPLRRALLAALCTTTIVAPAANAGAATLASYSFDDAASAFVNAPSTLADGLTAAPWQDADGSLTDFAGNPGRALGARNFHDGNTLLLTLSIPAGFVLALDAIAFDTQASSSGPVAWSLGVGGTTLAAGATATAFARETVTVGLAPFSGELAIALHGTGASSSLGTWRIDNFELSGTLAPVPLPASIALLAPALGLLGAWRRRR